MIECPNFLRITDYQYILMYSANEKVYLLSGDFIRTSSKYYFSPYSEKKVLDFGKHLYATQAFIVNNTILSFSWLLGSFDPNFEGVYSTPKVLSADSKYNVYINPYEGIKELYVSRIPIVHYNGSFPYEYIQKVPDLLDLQVTIPTASLNLDWSFGFNVHQDDTKKGVFVRYQHTTANVQIADTESTPEIVVSSEKINLKRIDGVSIRIFVDRGTIEVYVNKGETAGTYRFKEQSQYQYFVAVCSNPSSDTQIAFIGYELSDVW